MSNSVQKDEAPLLPPATSTSAVAARDFSRRGRRRHRPKRPFTSGHASNSVIPPHESKRQLVESGLLTAPLLLFHPIFISLRGLYHLCSHLYDNLRVRDRHMYHLSVADLFYVALECSILKMLRCDATAGYVDDDLLQMELTFKNLMLPSVLADYVDSIGMVTLANGLCIYPSLRFIYWENGLLRFHNNYVKRHFIHPCLLFAEAICPEGYELAVGLQIPVLQHEGVASIPKWNVVPSVVEHYRRLVPRMTKSVDMRVPSQSCDGQVNICVSRETMRQDTVVGLAPQCLGDEVAAVGAVYGWNHVEFRQSWPGDAGLLSPWTTGVPLSLSNAVATMVQTKMRLFPAN